MENYVGKRIWRRYWHFETLPVLKTPVPAAELAEHATAPGDDNRITFGMRSRGIRKWPQRENISSMIMAGYDI